MQPNAPLVSRWRSRWTVLEIKSHRSSPLNKLFLFPLDLDLRELCCAETGGAAIWFLFFIHQGGGDGGGWSVALLRSARQGAAAFCGGSQLRSIFALVTFGHRGHSVPWCCEHYCVFNLQAGVPSRRPLSDSFTALIVCSVPSGFVPGVGADGRELECIFFLSGQDLIAFSDLFLRSCL